MACNCKKNKVVIEEKKTIENLLYNPVSIERDFWLGTPSDDHEVDVDSLMDQARVFIDVQNHPVRQTYTIPVGNPEPQKSFKEKIKSFFKL